MGGTFGGVWNRPDHSGRGRSQRELQDQASYDNSPVTGCSCLIFALAILAAAVTALGLALT